MSLQPDCSAMSSSSLRLLVDHFPHVGIETITDPRRIQAIIRDLFFNQSRATLHVTDETSVPFVGVALNLKPDSSRPLIWQAQGLPKISHLTVRTFGYNSGFMFQASNASVNGGTVAIEMPEQIVRSHGQRHRRAGAPTGIYILLSSSETPSKTLKCQVQDVSFEGLSFLLPKTHPVRAGEAIGNLRVLWPTGAQMEFSATVQHVTRVRNKDTMCGVHLIPKSVEDKHCWMELISKLLYPRTIIASGLNEQLWDLFVRSGYFEISGQSEASFNSLQGGFANTNRRLSSAPHLGCQVCWLSHQRIEASVTLVKPYRTTWIGYQLARLKDGSSPATGRQILRDVLLHGYEYPQRDPEFAWMVTWVRVDARFSRHLMHTLTERFVHDPTRAALIRFRAMRGRTSTRPQALPPMIEISTPSTLELGVLLNSVSKTHPPSYIEAHDLTTDRIHIDSVRKSWSEAELERDREIFVLRKSGVPLAFATCELIEPGLHLFGLFDTVRLYSVDAHGKQHYTHLLQHARNWYKKRGRQTFAYFCEDIDYRHALDAGFEDLGEADMTILSAELMHHQLEHVWEITSPKDE